MYSLFDTIQSHIKDFESQLYTACPAIVERYNPEECTVDVYPAILRAEIDGLTIKEAMLDRVPLHFPATADVGMTYPLKKGDTVLLIFLQSDSENWFTKITSIVSPRTYRKHSLNDPIAIAGIFKYSASPVEAGAESDLNIYYKGSSVKIKEDGSISLSTPLSVTVDAPTTYALGAVETTGDVTISGISFLGHTHGGVTSGSGSTAPPNP